MCFEGLPKANGRRIKIFKPRHACSQTKHTATHLGHWPDTRETNVALNYTRHITKVMTRAIAQKRSYTCPATQGDGYCQALAVIALTPATTSLPLYTRTRVRPALQPRSPLYQKPCYPWPVQTSIGSCLPHILFRPFLSEQ